MKGVIFKYFESFATETFGADVYENRLERTRLVGSGAFGEPISNEATTCIHDGAASSQFEITFATPFEEAG